MKLSYVRSVDTYPTGRRRRLLLFMAVLANLVTAYESVIAPVVPLLLTDLDMTLAISTWFAVSDRVSSTMKATSRVSIR